MCQIKIDRNDSFRTPLNQQARIPFEQIAIVPMDSGDKEIITLPGSVLDASDNAGAVAIPNFVGDDSDSHGASFA